MGGAEYIASLMAGYTGEEKEEAGTIFYQNTAFPGGWISMAPPLSDEQVEFADGHANDVDAMGLSPWVVLALILGFYLVFGCLMDSLSMILLTIPIFFPVISAMDFGLLSLPAMQADAAMEVLKAGVPEGMGAETLASIKDAIAAGAELTREQMKELGIRVTEGRVNRIEAEYVAIWFGILVLIVVEVGLITPPVGMNLFIINAMDRKTKMIDTYKAVMFFVASDLIRVVVLVAFPIITLLPLMLMQ